MLNIRTFIYISSQYPSQILLIKFCAKCVALHIQSSIVKINWIVIRVALQRNTNTTPAQKVIIYRVLYSSECLALAKSVYFARVHIFRPFGHFKSAQFTISCAWISFILRVQHISIRPKIYKFTDKFCACASNGRFISWSYVSPSTNALDILNARCLSIHNAKSIKANTMSKRPLKVHQL